jgi:hypothetical protein
VRRRKFLLNFWGRNVEFVWVKISSSAKFKNIYRLLLEMLYVRVTCLYRLVMWSASIAISLGSYSQVTRVSRELHFSKWVGLCHAVFRCFNNGLSPIWIWRSTFCQLPFDFSITKWNGSSDAIPSHVLTVERQFSPPLDRLMIRKSTRNQHHVWPLWRVWLVMVWWSRSLPIHRPVGCSTLHNRLIYRFVHSCWIVDYTNL